MTQISNNYGIVLYELGISKDVIKAAVTEFAEAPTLKAVLINPTVELTKKHRIIDRLFPAEIHNFIKQVCDNQRMDRIEEIFLAYDEYVKKQEHVLDAVLYYVTPPTEEQAGKIEDFLLKKYQCKSVQLEMIVLPELMGGFIIRVGNEEYDWSLRGRLQQLKQKMIRR